MAFAVRHSTPRRVSIKVPCDGSDDEVRSRTPASAHLWRPARRGFGSRASAALRGGRDLILRHDETRRDGLAGRRKPLEGCVGWRRDGEVRPTGDGGAVLDSLIVCRARGRSTCVSVGWRWRTDGLPSYL
jgi:hypothetical protein